MFCANEDEDEVTNQPRASFHPWLRRLFWEVVENSIDVLEMSEPKLNDRAK
jgi:hypothetical protein